MNRQATMTASDFKARCLDVLDQLAARKLESVTITKRGRPVAVVRPPVAQAELPSLYGCMQGTVTIPEGVDIDGPILAEPLDADDGILHR
ncbi:MAG TPA: type II toxin-antitoxin system prevent-host-death family antitoxin [Beijerinckiaceae bacterium]|nr:type II toxin-antitoxin system prevent-host-death family antitoxin [Beijerinckiaceae bacterium]